MARRRRRTDALICTASALVCAAVSVGLFVFLPKAALAGFVADAPSVLGMYGVSAMALTVVVLLAAVTAVVAAVLFARRAVRGPRPPSEPYRGHWLER